VFAAILRCLIGIANGAEAPALSVANLGSNARREL